MAYKQVSITPTIDTAVYAAGDVVGTALTWTLDSQDGILKQVRILDNDSESAQMVLYLFSTAPSAGCTTDQAAFVPVDADLAKLIATVPVAVTDYSDHAAGSEALVWVDRPFSITGSKVLYGALVCVATPTYTAATDLTVTLLVETR